MKNGRFSGYRLLVYRSAQFYRGDFEPVNPNIYKSSVQTVKDMGIYGS